MTTRTIPAIAAVLLVALGAVACSPNDGPTPSESSTSSPSDSASPSGEARDVLDPPTFDVPSDADTAAADAQEAAEAAHAAIVHVEFAEGEGVDALSLFLRGEPLNSSLANIEAIQVGDATITGSASYDATSAVVSDLTRNNGAEVPFGAAVVTGCADYSEYSVVGNDDVPIAWPNGGLFEIDYSMEFEDDGRWIVVGETATGLPCEA